MSDTSGSVRCEVGALFCCPSVQQSYLKLSISACPFRVCLFLHCGCIILSSFLTGTTSPTVDQSRSRKELEDTWN